MRRLFPLHAALVTTLMLLGAWAPCYVGAAQSPASGPSSEPSGHQFRAEALGRSGKKGAVYVSFGRYVSEDGVVVERFVDSYKTPSEAAAAFYELKKSASHVLQQDWKTGPDGVRIGPRVELAFDRRGDATRRNVIAWTEKDSLVRLRSKSLAHLRDFEKQVRPAAPPSK